MFRKKVRLTVWVMLFFAAALVYFQSLSSTPFGWDENDFIVIPIMQYGLDYFSWPGDRFFFRPIEYFINYLAWKSDPETFWLSHSISIAMLAGTAAATASLFRQFGEAGRSYSVVAAFAVLFFDIGLQGCPFHTRCPMMIEGLCDRDRPPLHELDDNHLIACHRETEDLMAQKIG